MYRDEMRKVGGLKRNIREKKQNKTTKIKQAYETLSVSDTSENQQTLNTVLEHMAAVKYMKSKGKCCKRRAVNKSLLRVDVVYASGPRRGTSHTGMETFHQHVLNRAGCFFPPSLRCMFTV